jgi:hypothetical protein
LTFFFHFDEFFLFIVFSFIFQRPGQFSASASSSILSSLDLPSGGAGPSSRLQPIQQHKFSASGAVEYNRQHHPQQQLHKRSWEVYNELGALLAFLNQN